MQRTLTYSEAVNGWTSFYSFIPERMIGMNNKFYSFKGGNLFVHNSDNVDRNEFYEENYDSEIEGVINDGPHDVKTFKTFVLESTAPWRTTVESDLGQGVIESAWYSLKEGDYFAHIRRVGVDFDFRSAIGLSNISSFEVVGSSYVITMSFNVDSMVSVGDVFYTLDDGFVYYVGIISNIEGDVITAAIDIQSNNPVVGELGLINKDSTAESYGTTGYYLKYRLVNGSRNFVELFAIGSNLFKSYP